MSDVKVKLKIVSPVGVVFDGEVSHVVLPGEVGAFAIYPRHAPIISSLVKGNVRFTDAGNQERLFAITEGFVEVNNNTVTVCAELPEVNK